MNLNEENLNDVWGEPYIYNDVKIHPIKLKDALEFYQYSQCLTIDKNTIPSPEIIRMNYLEFIILLSQEKNYRFLYEYLIKLLSLVFQEQLFNIVADDKSGKLTIKVLNNSQNIKQYNEISEEYKKIILELNTNKKDEIIEKFYSTKKQLDDLMANNSVFLTGKDFDKIRRIILKQNLIKFDDELVNAEVKQALDESLDFINKRNKDKKATLEELIVSYVSEICNGKPQDFKDVKELTIYQFYKVLQRKSLSKQQMMLSTALGMGALSLNDIPDWLDHVSEQDMYKEAILNDEEKAELNDKLQPNII